VIDPVARTLEVFHAGAGQWVLIGSHAEDEEVRGEPFAEVPLTLGVLWPPVSPR
jgi:Uma2 family endonuclease